MATLFRNDAMLERTK